MTTSAEAVSAGEVLDFRPAAAFSLVVLPSPTGSATARLELEGLMAPRSGGPPVHVHPQQEETFEVVEGTATVMLDGERRELRAGQRLTVPRGVAHTIRNDHDQLLRALTTVEPALDFERLLRRLAGAIGDGRIRSLPPRDPRSALHLALLMHDHAREQVDAVPPRAVVAVLARIARLARLTV